MSIKRDEVAYIREKKMSHLIKGESLADDLRTVNTESTRQVIRIFSDSHHVSSNKYICGEILCTGHLM